MIADNALRVTVTTNDALTKKQNGVLARGVRDCSGLHPLSEIIDSNDDVLVTSACCLERAEMIDVYRLKRAGRRRDR